MSLLAVCSLTSAASSPSVNGLHFSSSRSERCFRKHCSLHKTVGLFLGRKRPSGLSSRELSVWRLLSTACFVATVEYCTVRNSRFSKLDNSDILKFGFSTSLVARERVFSKELQYVRVFVLAFVTSCTPFNFLHTVLIDYLHRFPGAASAVCNSELTR